jgi:hypothetical protein
LTYLGFVTEGKLAAIFIKPSLGVSNWPVIYFINYTPASFLAPFITAPSLFTGKYLRHHIRSILFGMDLLKLHHLGTHEILNPMIPHITMLCSRVETWILGTIDSILTITK